MRHEYKVGDRVRNVCSDYKQEIGEFIGEEVSNGTVVSLVDGKDSVTVLFDGCENDYYCYNREIEPYTEITEPTHTAADAFRRIHASLDDAVNAMLDDANHDAAIEYAIMMLVIERDYLTPKPTT